MLKHVLLLIILSIVAILFIHQLTHFLLYIGYSHTWLSRVFQAILSGFNAGRMVSHILALVIIPFIFALIPAFIYWIIKRGEMPHLMTLVWIIWIMLTTIIALR